jgi:hypothetical protein
MNFPYGISDFHRLITSGYFYADRTGHLPLIEKAGDQLVFLRPQRFGKSLLLSMLENYYDLAKADEFERLFGHLAIGRNPTPRHNQYFVLKWDFSNVKAQGDSSDLEIALHEYLNQQIRDFAEYYQGRLARPIEIIPKNAVASFVSLQTAVRLTPHRLYLLIDEYDNFANELLMRGGPDSQNRYQDLVQGEGMLKTIFKAIKSASTGRGLERVFITGVAPLALSDVSSGYNVSKNLSLSARFQDLCGFTESEIRQTLDAVTAECRLPAEQAEAALMQMRLYYNGYSFSDTPREFIYNPTLALYFLDQFQQDCRPPSNLLDRNLAMDDGKLSYIAGLPGGGNMIVAALHDEADTLNVPELADRFGVRDVLASAKGPVFMASLLHYFGVLTLTGRSAIHNLQLRIPNLVIRKLYVERLREMLLPGSSDQQEARLLAERFYQTGDLHPVCEFMEQRYFKVFSNRDYMQANELTLKTAFLTLLFNDQLYIMESEAAAGRRYTDLTMILRPDLRQVEAFDLVLEFKFLKPGDLGLSGEQLRELDRTDLAALPLVREKLAEARAQTGDYLRELRGRYGASLRPRVYAVIGMGFERLVWEEIE